jgi:hypothetical protein
MEHIGPKAIERSIMAMTPTDVLHKATFITTALLSVYNHVFMALPVETHISQNFSLGYRTSITPSKWMVRQNKRGDWWKERD